jgi:GGDEF domain-containing protein
MRPSDALYRFGYPGCYLLVLAGTAVEGAEVVRQRLLRRVDYSPTKGVGPIEIFAAGPDAETPDLLSLVDKIAGRFRDASPLALGGSCPVEVAQEPKAGAVDAFIRRLRMETSLAVRNGFALHLVGITADTPGDVDAMLLARHVHEAGLRALRPTDGVYALGPHQAVIILPCTAEEEAATVAHRLVQAVRARDPDAAYGSVETQVLGLGDPHPDVASFLEALGRHSRGGRR